MSAVAPPLNPSRLWKNRQPLEVRHRNELLVMTQISRALIPFDMIAIRYDDPYAPLDLAVLPVDMATLEWYPPLCGIDLEHKRAAFPEDRLPAEWRRGASFLARKVDKPGVEDRDIYCLFDISEPEPRIIWAPFGLIREHGTVEYGGGEKFYSIRPLDEARLGFGLDAMAAYLAGLEAP